MEGDKLSRLISIKRPASGAHPLSQVFLYIDVENLSVVRPYKKLRVSAVNGAPKTYSLNMALTSRMQAGNFSCSVLVKFCNTKSAVSICSGVLGPMPTRTRA